LDETSFVKKGDASVGGQRQYCGRLAQSAAVPILTVRDIMELLESYLPRRHQIRQKTIGNARKKPGKHNAIAIN
jgi:hypothetical protein